MAPPPRLTCPDIPRALSTPRDAPVSPLFSRLWFGLWEAAGGGSGGRRGGNKGGGAVMAGWAQVGILRESAIFRSASYFPTSFSLLSRLLGDSWGSAPRTTHRNAWVTDHVQRNGPPINSLKIDSKLNSPQKSVSINLSLWRRKTSPSSSCVSCSSFERRAKCSGVTAPRSSEFFLFTLSIISYSNAGMRCWFGLN